MVIIGLKYPNMADFSAVTRIVVVGSVWTDAAHHYHLWKDKRWD